MTGNDVPAQLIAEPLDAQGNCPERGSSYVLQEWMTWFAVEPPCQASAGLCEQLFDLEVAERVLMAVAKEAPPDDASC